VNHEPFHRECAVTITTKKIGVEKQSPLIQSQVSAETEVLPVDTVFESFKTEFLPAPPSQYFPTLAVVPGDRVFAQEVKVKLLYLIPGQSAYRFEYSFLRLQSCKGKVKILKKSFIAVEKQSKERTRNDFGNVDIALLLREDELFVVATEVALVLRRGRNDCVAAVALCSSYRRTRNDCKSLLRKRRSSCSGDF
jgi:hypothetical protein